MCEQVLPARSAHRCLKCGLGVHAICGQNPDGDEGYGVPVLCNTFLKSTVSAEDKQKNGELLPQ